MLQYDLASCPLFSEMLPSEIEVFVEHCVSDIKEFEKGEYVVRQGTPINHLYLLVSGLVRTAMLTRDDNILEIETLAPVIPLAPAFLFANRNIFPVDVITLEPTVLFLIPRTTLQEEMMRNAKLLQNMLRINANMIVFLSQKVQMLSIRSLRYTSWKTPRRNKISFTYIVRKANLPNTSGCNAPLFRAPLGRWLLTVLSSLAVKRLWCVTVKN